MVEIEYLYFFICGSFFLVEILLGMHFIESVPCSFILCPLFGVFLYYKDNIITILACCHSHICFCGGSG